MSLASKIRSEKLRPYILALGWILSLLCLGFFVRFLAEHWHHVSDVEWDSSAWLVMGSSILLYLVAGLSSILVWRVFLHAVGERADMLPVARVYLIAQFAKYLPGNVAHHIGRVALAGQVGMRMPRVIFSMVVETVWSMIVLTALTLTSFLVVGDQWLKPIIGFSPMQDLQVTGTLLVIVFGLMVWGVRRWSLRKRDDLEVEDGVTTPGVGAYVATMLMVILNMLLMSVVVGLLGTYLFQVQRMDYWLVLAGVIVSWTLGFVTPGAPAGLGVRELVLVGMLGSLGAANAVGIAALLRVITALGDVLMFVIGLLLPKRAVSST